jgi:hypothetical protein
MHGSGTFNSIMRRYIAEPTISGGGFRPTASRNDFQSKSNHTDTGEPFIIVVYDHKVFGAEYYSFADHGII